MLSSLRHPAPRAVALMLGIVGFLLVGCSEDDTELITFDVDTMVVSLNGGPEETIFEQQDETIGFGGDPLIVTSRLTSGGGGGGAFTAAAMARDWTESINDYSNVVVLFFDGAAPGTYTSEDGGGTGMFYNDQDLGEFNADPGSPGSSVSITIDEYGAVSELVTGSFSGTLVEDGGGAGTLDISGSFLITREEDNWIGFSDGESQCPNLGSTTVHMETIPEFSGGPYADTIMELHDGGGFLCSNDDGAIGLFSQLQANLQSGQTYYLRVVGFSGSTGPYGIRVDNVGSFQNGSTSTTATCPADAGEDGNDTIGGAEAITVNENPPTLSRCVQAGDDDWFQFTVP